MAPRCRCRCYEIRYPLPVARPSQGCGTGNGYHFGHSGTGNGPASPRQDALPPAISAREVEELLITHEAVAEVALIGLPDPETGERACAVVVPARPDSPPGLASLCEHLLAHGLSTRKLPEQLQIVAALPRNAMGKVVKRELTAQFTAQFTPREPR